MEFTVSKSDLVRELSLSQGVVEKKTTIPILSNVLLEAAGDRVILTATDLELGIRCSCPARVKKEGAGTIPARRLLDYVRLLPDADITFKFLENHWARITCGRSKTRIAGMSRESFPELPEMPEPIGEIPFGVLAWLDRAHHLRDLHGRVPLHAEWRSAAAEARRRDHGRDRRPPPGVRRPADWRTPTTTCFRALVPRKAMAEIAKLAGEGDPDRTCRLSGDDNHLFFEFGDRLLITRKLTGNFPDYERVLPKDNTHIALLAKSEIKVRHRTRGAVCR